MYEVFLCALLLVEFYINDNLHYIFIFIEIIFLRFLRNADRGIMRTRRD